MTTMHPAQVRAKRLENDEDFFSYIKKLGSQAVDAAGLDYFKNKANFWATKVRNLATMKVPSSLEAERRSLLQKAMPIRYTVEKIIGNMPSLENIGLGFVMVVVGAAAVAAAVASITYWITDYNKFLAKLDAAQRAQGAGLTPQQSADYVQTIDSGAAGSSGGIFGGSVFGSVAKYALPLLVVGGVAIFLMSKRDDS